MLASFALRIFGLVATFALGLLLARIWSPADFGIYGLVISVAALATTVCQLGTPQLAVREFAVFASNGDFASIRQRNRQFQLATLAASLVPVGLAGVLIFHDWRLLNVAPMYWLIGAFLNLFAVQVVLLSAGLRGAGKMTQGQFMDILGRPGVVLLLVAGLWLLFGTPKIATVLMVQLCATVVAAFVCYVWFLDTAGAAGRATEAPRTWLRAAVPLGLIDILRQLDGTYGLILMGWLVSGTELGWFRVALSCAALINMPITIFHVVLAPRLAVLFKNHDHETLQAMLRKVSLLMTAISGLIALGLALFGEFLIVLAFGAPYAGALPPLLIISVAQLAFSLFGMGPILLLMVDLERQLTVIYVIAVSAGILAAWLLIPLHGAAGAALGQLVSLFLIGALSDFVARRRLGLRVGWIRWPFRRAALLP